MHCIGQTTSKNVEWSQNGLGRRERLYWSKCAEIVSVWTRIYLHTKPHATENYAGQNMRPTSLHVLLVHFTFYRRKDIYWFYYSWELLARKSVWCTHRTTLVRTRFLAELWVILPFIVCMYLSEHARTTLVTEAKHLSAVKGPSACTIVT